MLGQIGPFASLSADEDDALDFSLQGYGFSRIMNTLCRSSSETPGPPVCVAASYLDSLVLS
ncbi:uncharacterized protein LY79DRAFT_554210 [Colletotrichum navitas]|uniref:Uncharacterized protein n=1 Tax=Colletotrichum navitas TaxID=681940 RepID=A0AAD8V5X3_9PEZI|nr:uncharacterized protein LY79DRAFT_554210 [Colletotrichum navitas]KAK1590568.1 hypothetical protein LY79DRAFT_554210 [Colletotrichum navitas]